MRMLILSYTIQQVIPNVSTKFQNLGAVVSEKSLRKEKSLHTDTQTNIVTENYILRMPGVGRGNMVMSLGDTD